MKVSLGDFTWWLNLIVIVIFVGLAIYEHDFKRVPWSVLILNFLIVNAGFILLAMLINYQANPAIWLQVMRLVVLLIITAMFVVCHYYSITHKSAGTGMLFLIAAGISLGTVVLMEGFIWLHAKFIA